MANSGGASENFASKISGTPPWWASAPIWLAAGIVGVPSLLAIGAGYYLAHFVTRSLAKLDQYEQVEMHVLNEHVNDQKRTADIVLKFMDDNLKAQYQTCLNAAKTSQERNACISPRERERQYGLTK